MLRGRQDEHYSARSWGLVGAADLARSQVGAFLAWVREHVVMSYYGDKCALACAAPGVDALTRTPTNGAASVATARSPSGLLHARFCL